MYQIKQIPEDFIVREISGIKFSDSGQYCYFALKKRNYNTIRAIQAVAKKLRINEKNIGFAGNKDKNALTEQLISIKNGNESIGNLKIKDIELKYLGKGNEAIYLGNLKGNEFTITIRNLEKKDTRHIAEKIKNRQILMPNYFGQQRFSSNNSLIGKLIIKSHFKEAIGLIMKSNSDYNEKIKAHLKKQKNDFVGALKIIPFQLLKLYAHSYQSFLFNKALEQYIETQNNNKKTINKKNNGSAINSKIPIIGFATEISSREIEKIIKKIMEEESIGFRDFIIRAIPGLSAEGSERNALIKIDDFKIINEEKDELNDGKKKMVVSFSLPKGCYATVLVDYLLN